MMNYYKVAGHTFGVKLPDGDPLCSQLAQYEPFISPAVPDPIFVLSLADSLDDEGGELVYSGEPQSGEPIVRLFSTPGGWISEMAICPGRPLSAKLFMEKDFSAGKLLLLRPREYSVLAMPNLNGDYMSDALAAQVGGLGMAPGSNIGDGYAIFEATHGTAPKYAGLDKTNPGSIILSGAMMLDYLGWTEAADLVRKGVQGAVANKTVTYDLARQMPDATKVACSAFGKAICDNM